MSTVIQHATLHGVVQSEAKLSGEIQSNAVLVGSVAIPQTANYALQEKTIVFEPELSGMRDPATQTIEPDADYDGISKLVVDVPLGQIGVSSCKINKQGYIDSVTKCFKSGYIREGSSVGGGPAIKVPSLSGGTYTPSTGTEPTVFSAGNYLLNDIVIEPIPYNEVTNNTGGLTVTIGG